MPRQRMTAVLAGLALAAAGTGCGQSLNHDVPGFIAQGKNADERAVLRSIATYRETKDEARACSLVTAAFLKRRFEGKVDNCEQVLRTASRHLPDRARVDILIGDTARVFVDEPSATNSYYEMSREGGVWKIDDIVDAN